MKRYWAGLSIPLVLVLAACGSDAPPGTPVVVPVTAQVFATQPAQEPTQEPAVEPAQPGVSFEAATYRDEAAGYEFDYPASWVPDEEVFGDRGAGVQFGSGEEIWFSSIVLQWDPKNDLDAYIAQRELAFSASDMTVLAEEELTLAGGRRAVSYVIEQVEGQQSYYMFTTLGDRYLQMSGGGDLDLLAEIAGTVRPLDGGS